MSVSPPSASPTLLHWPWLARLTLSACTVMLLGGPSCLVTSTTDFPVPEPSPPFVDTKTALASPVGGTSVPVTKLLRIDKDTQEVSFSTDVQSEDQGRLLYARVFVNYNVSPNGNYEDFGGGETLQPSTFDQVRRISATLKPQVLGRLNDGCYQVTLIITHAFDNSTLLPVRQDDTAIVVWWMLKGDPAQLMLAQCPGVPPSPDTDAGSDTGTD